MSSRAALWAAIATAASLALACSGPQRRAREPHATAAPPTAPARPAPPPDEESSAAPRPSVVAPQPDRLPKPDVVSPAEPGAVPPAEPAAQTLAPLEITFVGDVIFGRYVKDGRRSIAAGDYNLFGEVADLVRADVAVANLETPVAREVPPESPYGTRLRFAATLEEARHLVRGGFTAVTLANNHSYDLRLSGLVETPEALAEIGIVALGAARVEPPVFHVDTIEHDGWRIGFIGVTTERNGPQREGQPVLPYVDSARDMPEALVPVIQQARETHDVIVVLAHWGTEYDEEPERRQRIAAHALIDAGADLVVGHHPHVLQGFERYHGGLIAYSLGNFRFDDGRDVPRLSAVLRARFASDGRCLEQITLHPTYLRATRRDGIRFHRPLPASGNVGKSVRARVTEKSSALDTEWERDGNDLVLRFAGCADSAGQASP